jgi:preprotein translocase subunit SecB
MADTENQTGEQAVPQADASAISFRLQRIYIKDVSFEAPSSPRVFQTPYQPKVNFNMTTKAENFQDNFYEAVLTITTEVNDQEDKPIYVIEIQQAGIFEIKGLKGEDLQHALHVTCPSVLFPYARETVDNLAIKGTFPALHLPPANFEAIYDQARKSRDAQVQQT